MKERSMAQTLYAGGKVFTEKQRCEDGLGLLVEGDTIKRIAPLEQREFLNHHRRWSFSRN